MWRALVHVVPGLEDVAGEEIAAELPGAEMVGAWRGFDERTSLLEYRTGADALAWLALDTVEDVFALAARGRSLREDKNGLGELAAAVLSSKSLDTALGVFALCRGQPRTFRVVARKAGTHSYRRVDAQRAVEGALHRRLPRLRLVEDDADAEFWLTIIGRVALLGIRLSTHEMRGHRQPFASLPAALKPTIAHAMARLSSPREGDRVLDPFCGAGTLLLARGEAGEYGALLGGDIDRAAVSAARRNLRAAGLRAEIQEWDALALPLRDASVDAIITNPPFGKRVAIPGGNPYAFYADLVAELRRVLRPGGRLVLITSQADAFTRALRAVSPPLAVRRRIHVLVRGERATIFVAE